LKSIVLAPQATCAQRKRERERERVREGEKRERVVSVP